MYIIGLRSFIKDSPFSQDRKRGFLTIWDHDGRWAMGDRIVMGEMDDAAVQPLGAASLCVI